MATVTMQCPNKGCPQAEKPQVVDDAIVPADVPLPTDARVDAPTTRIVTCGACASEMEPVPVIAIVDQPL